MYAADTVLAKNDCATSTVLPEADEAVGRSSIDRRRPRSYSGCCCWPDWQSLHLRRSTSVQ